MSRTQYYCAATLDGFIADAGDGIDWLTGYEGSYDGEGAVPSPMSDGGAYERFYENVGALVSGSATYEFVIEHGSSWPYAGKPYRVLSSRDLPKPEGHEDEVCVVEAEAGDIHPDLVEAAAGKNVWIVGGGGVASQFAEAGLLDDLILTVVPVVLGEGKPLFEKPLPGALQLRGSTVFDSGMVELSYELKR
jgi:dihydrofolate reductase